MNTEANGCGCIHQEYILSPTREFNDVERELIWKKPSSHKVSIEELRICKEIKRNWHRGEMKIANILLEGDAGSGKTQLAKALSANLGLPYTKVTCFADMDKSDIIGAILPVISAEDLEKMEPMEQGILKALYESDGMYSAIEILMDVFGVTQEQAALKMKQLMKKVTTNSAAEVVEYRFYPSEIVRAYQKGYLLEIQEPTVIRDAAVLMALNSALELDGSINLPTEIIRRHPDFIAVITTNRNYAGCRPLNEALRDRVQHTEKMDLPSKEIMIERAKAKTGYENEQVLGLLAETIILLDKTARANAIKGVAGMRSLFYWVDAVANGASANESLYHKVIYKITTDSEEIKLLEEALKNQGLLASLDEIEVEVKKNGNSDAADIKTEEDMDTTKPDLPNNSEDKISEDNSISLKMAADSENNQTHVADETTNSLEDTSKESADLGEESKPIYHPDPKVSESKTEQQKEKDFRKKLNQAARKVVTDSMHKGVKLIVHRPDYLQEDQEEYHKLGNAIMPIVQEIARRTLPLLEHEISADFARNHYYGSKFQADSVAYQDFRYFSKKRPPTEAPSLVVGLRVDESASMSAFGRMEAAKRAVIAVYEFCQICDIPVLIYGDTADVSKIEQMSVFAYTDLEKKDPNDRFRLMGIRGRSNNRDGMALRIIADRLTNSSALTKLLISISDGQPKAMDDYTGSLAVEDMQQTIAHYERKGITFLAAAIGQDKDVISQIYGKERFLDITNLNEFPAKLVKIIARYL